MKRGRCCLRSVLRSFTSWCMIFSILLCIFPTDVKADSVRKSQGYLLDDVTYTLGGAANFPSTGDYTFNNSSIVTFDFSSVDFSFINDMTSGTYTIGLSGLVSCSDTFTNCEYVSDDASSMHMVFDEFMFDESIALSGEFVSSYEAVNALENLQMQIYSKPTVNVSGASQIRYEREVTFTNLVLTVSWEENSSTGNAERLAITSQPLDAEVVLGDYANFSVTAQGTGLTYQWQYKVANGNKWNNSGALGSDTANISVESTEKRNGQKYRCIITDSSGNQIVSEAAAIILVEEDTEIPTEVPTETPDTDTEIDSPDIPEDTEVIENDVVYAVSNLKNLTPTYSGGVIGENGETYLEAVYYDKNYNNKYDLYTYGNLSTNENIAVSSGIRYVISGLPSGTYNFTFEHGKYTFINYYQDNTDAILGLVDTWDAYICHGPRSDFDKGKYEELEHYLVTDGQITVNEGEDYIVEFKLPTHVFDVISCSASSTVQFYASLYDCHLKIYKLVKETDVQQNQLIEEGNKLQEESNKLQEEENEISGNILDKISDFFGGFFDNLINLFTSVFVPEDGYFEEYFARLNEFFSEKLGMLYVPIEMLLEFLGMFLDESEVFMPGFYFPGVKWEDMYVIEPQYINLASIIGQIPDLQDTIYFVSDVVLIFSVIYLLQSKLREMLTT